MGLQKLNHLTSHLNNVEMCVINMITQNLYFGFCQTFQPNKCVRDETDLSQTSNSSGSWTQEAVNMAALAGSCCGVDMSVDSSSWNIRNEQKLTWKVLGTSSLPQLEKNKLKEGKEIQKSQASRISSYTKKKKNSVKYRARDSNLAPLVYEASVLPTELSFRLNNWEKIMLYNWIYIKI